MVKKILSIFVLSGVMLWSGSALALEGLRFNGLSLNGNAADAPLITSLASEGSQFLQKTQLQVKAVELPELSQAQASGHPVTLSNHDIVVSRDDKDRD